MLEKDTTLNEIAEHSNVAQFVSFGPGKQFEIRFCRIRNIQDLNLDVSTIIQILLNNNPEHSVNIRSFRPNQTKGGEFLYGLKAIDEVMANVKRLTSDGWYVIVNETIDVNDGGVSGVSIGDTIEFAPADTPRCVEKPGTCQLSLELGSYLLETVYGFKPNLPDTSGKRIEFSIHPIRRGYHHEHTILWELEASPDLPTPAFPQWPNRFSQFLGDKVFGLLIASVSGARVPKTVVLSKNIAPFDFGMNTGTNEYWQRTAPSIQSPGKLPTNFGWCDPYLIWKEIEDSPTLDDNVSLISQEGVEAEFSGAAAIMNDGNLLVEGVKGNGVDFMLGRQSPESLPEHILDDVNSTLINLSKHCGPVRMEWANDGMTTWVLQLHVGSVSENQNVISEGEAENWIDYYVKDGLEKLRIMTNDIEGKKIGVRLLGNVGITSHFGDLLRGKSIPGVLIRENNNYSAT